MYPEPLEPPRVVLQRLWRGLEACERTHDPEALERHRVGAARSLNCAVEGALMRVGLGRMAELFDDVSFLGW